MLRTDGQSKGKRTDKRRTKGRTDETRTFTDGRTDERTNERTDTKRNLLSNRNRSYLGSVRKEERNGCRPSLIPIYLSFGNVRKIVYTRAQFLITLQPEITFIQLFNIILHCLNIYLPLFQLVRPLFLTFSLLFYIFFLPTYCYSDKKRHICISKGSNGRNETETLYELLMLFTAFRTCPYVPHGTPLFKKR